jgi:tetratricopeptide (TPR) repeat protein
VRELARLEQEVTAALQQFSALKAPIRPQRQEAFVDELVALGPLAGPLLVPHLEPAGDDAVERARARAVAVALSRMQGPALTDPLLSVLAQGSDEARRNALRALETSTERERVRPVLLAAFEAAPAGAFKQSALRAVVRLGGPENARLYAQILSQEDSELVALALRARVDTRDASAGPQVRTLLSDSSKAQRHAELLLEYYAGLPELVDSELLERWVSVVDKAGKLQTRVMIIDALPGLAGSSGSDLRKALQPLVSATDPKLREAVLVALVRLGDRSARRDLLEGYDDFVDRNDDIAEAYVRRGKVYLRIEDWDDAIRDFQQALRLARSDPSPQPEAYVGLARAYARRGRLRDAAEWLRKAPISLKELRALADDPDFAELRASRYSADAFGF